MRCECQEAIGILGLEKVATVETVAIVQNLENPLVRDIDSPEVHAATDKNEIAGAEVRHELRIINMNVFLVAIFPFGHETIAAPMKATTLYRIPCMRDPRIHVTRASIHHGL